MHPGPAGWGQPVPWGPPPPRGPVSDAGARLGAKLLDSLIQLVAVVPIVAHFARQQRPITGLVVAGIVVFAYETALVALTGTTPGKRAAGLRVVALDATGRPSWARAARRAGTDAALAALVLVGWVVAGAGVVGDPLRRGAADRAADTMVVPDDATLPVRARDLPGYADGVRRPRVGPLGRVADSDVRVRARLRRFADAPALAVLTGLLALLFAVVHAGLAALVGTILAWIAVFAVDEARRIHRDGATAGHRLAGLVVLDVRTGRPPSAGRAFARALALGLALYLLVPLLLVEVAMMRFGATGRTLHDRIGRTVVVADPRLDPEAQRQRSMAVRLGRAG